MQSDGSLREAEVAGHMASEAAKTIGVATVQICDVLQDHEKRLIALEGSVKSELLRIVQKIALWSDEDKKIRALAAIEALCTLCGIEDW